MSFKIVAIVALCAVAASAAAFSEEEYQFIFRQWMNKHKLAPYHHDEIFTRYNIFKKAVDTVHAHNAKKASFTMAVNQFADLTAAEFKAKNLGYKLINKPYARSQNTADLSSVAPAASVDWRTKNAVTPIKDQGQCGSCWAFSTTGSTEGAFAIAKGQLVSLSEQQLVDCSTSYGNQGCNGGLMDQGFEYIIAKGICTEASYPYTAADGSCQDSSCTYAWKAGAMSGFKDVTSGDENALLAAANLGPVSVAIEADQSVFQYYSSGVLNDQSCGTQLDHGVLVVGYDVAYCNGTPCWVVKNSWGSSWGASGYIYLYRGNNMCGLTQQPSYPTIA